MLIRVLFILAVCLGPGCQTPKSPNMQSYFPFELTEIPGRFVISVPVESKEVMDRYYHLFENRGLSGNGYSWEHLIKDIIADKNEALLSHTTFDSEAGAFYAYTPTSETRQQLAKVLGSVFNDEKKLASYLSAIDPEEADD